MSYINRMRLTLFTMGRKTQPSNNLSRNTEKTKTNTKCNKT